MRRLTTRQDYGQRTALHALVVRVVRTTRNRPILCSMCPADAWLCLYLLRWVVTGIRVRGQRAALTIVCECVTSTDRVSRVVAT